VNYSYGVFENMSDMVMSGVFSNTTGENILNSLDAVYLGDVYDQKSLS